MKDDGVCNDIIAYFMVARNTCICSLNKYYVRMLYKFMSWFVALLLMGYNGGIKIVDPFDSTI